MTGEMLKRQNIFWGAGRCFIVKKERWGKKAQYINMWGPYVGNMVASAEKEAEPSPCFPVPGLWGT